jgi:hypothetical protein
VPHALNTGVLCDGLRAIDIDVDDPEIASRCRSLVVQRFGEAPIRMRRNSPRCLVLYRAATGTPPKIVLAGRLGKIEVLGKGQQFVAFGCHPTGVELEWFPEPPGQELLASLPAIEEDALLELLDQIAPILEASPPQRLNGHEHASGEPQADPLRIATALNAIPNAGPADWEAWNRIGMAVWRATGGSEIGWQAFNAWSARHASYDPAEARKRWEHYETSPPTSIGAGSLFHMARLNATSDDGAARGTPQEDKPEPLLESITLDAIGRQNIAPRPWAYGHYLLFGKTAVLGAVDGGGKGAIATTMILAHVFGQPLLGEKIWKAGHVSIITYEDDEAEWHRRIAAACHHYGLDYTLAMWSVHFIRKPGGRVALVAPARDGLLYPDGDAIIAELKATGSTLLIVDPFNHAHMLDDGNNNVMIAKVAAEMDRIAEATGAAIMVLHHLRKGSTGQADDLMGATSLRATFRSSRILSRMTQDEAEALNIEEGWRYIRIKGSKENYAPPPNKATWYMLASVPLGNQSETYPDGDNIAVATVWAPPSPWDGMPMDVVIRVLELVEHGPTDGEFYTASRRGRSNDRWVGNLLVQVAQRQPDNSGLIVAEWIRSGLLIEGNYQSPKERKLLACVRVDPTTLADMKKTSAPPAAWDC